jgi:hypothetical protein
VPTIIDTLIVELGLDPSKFTDGQKKATEAMRGLESASDRSAKNIGGIWGQLAKHPFFAPPGSSSSSPFANPGTHLTRLETQARQSGISVAKSVDLGSASLARLGAAGLAAFGALKTIQGALGEISRAAVGTVQTGRVAEYTGVSPKFMSSIARGAYLTNNADMRGTEESLFNLQQRIIDAKLGSTNVQQEFLSRLGIQWLDFNKDPQQLLEEILTQLGPKLAAMKEPERQAYGQRFNFSRELTQSIAQNGLGRLRGVGEPYVPTPEQFAELKKLQAAINGVNLAWDTLTVTVLAQVSPALRENLDLLDKWILDNKTIIGQDVDAVVKGFATVLREAGIKEVGRDLHEVAQGFLEIVDAVKKLDEFLHGDLGKILNFGFHSALNPLYALTHGLPNLNSGAVPADTRNAWQRFAPSWLGGKEAPGGGGGFSRRRGGAADTSYLQRGAPSGGDPRGMEGAIRSAAMKYGHDPDVAVRVARSEGLGSFTGDAGTSFGSFQLHIGGGLGDQFRRETGLDPSDPKNELATIDFAMRHLGETGWSPYHGAARVGIGSRSGIGVAAPQTASARASSGLFAYGDSIAVGVRGAGNLPGDAVGGRTPEQVLAALQQNAENLRGQRVILSSGASNAWQPKIVERQLAFLQSLQAKPVLLGVGAGVRDYEKINAQLGDMAKRYNVPFTGELETTQRNGGVVHPTGEGYRQVLDHAKRVAGEVIGIRSANAAEVPEIAHSLRDGGYYAPIPKGIQYQTGNSSVTHNAGDVSVNGPIHVHTNATDAGGIARSISRELRRSLRSVNVDNGVE